MDKTFLCDVSEKDSKKLLSISEMKRTLESLVSQIAGNNDILKEDSTLYVRLLDDYKENLNQFNEFWAPYFEKYGHLLNENKEFSVDFSNNKLYIIKV